mmetsp:Transcript_20474/g.51534  ORF Transcript_20474/g.51534 Transcript_20474/m.51534 type:complete len:102 (-) Transcript_20474:1586-1891(-)
MGRHGQDRFFLYQKSVFREAVSLERWVGDSAVLAAAPEEMGRLEGRPPGLLAAGGGPGGSGGAGAGGTGAPRLCRAGPGADGGCVRNFLLSAQSKTRYLMV